MNYRSLCSKVYDINWLKLSSVHLYGEPSTTISIILATYDQTGLALYDLMACISNEPVRLSYFHS